MTSAGGLRSPLRYRDFRRLWIAQIASELGDWAARLGLVVLVAERTHSAALSALVITVSVIPFVGLGPLLATFANRYSRLHTIVFTDLGRAAIFALLALPMPTIAVFALAFLAGCLTPPFESARNALVPLAVPEERLGDAVSVVSITTDLSVLGGYVAGGALISLVGPHTALLVNACSFLVSAAVLSGVSVARAPVERGDEVRVRDGWRAVVDEPYVRRFLVSYTVTSACALVPESLVAVYALQVLVAPASTSGWLAAAIPVGTIIAVVLARPRRGSDAFKLQRAGLIGMVGALTGALIFAWAPGLPLIVFGFVAVGALYATRVPGSEVAALHVEDRLRVPAFSVLSSVLVGLQAIAAAAGGIVAQSYGVTPTIVVALLIAAAVGAWGAANSPYEPRHARRTV